MKAGLAEAAAISDITISFDDSPPAEPWILRTTKAGKTLREIHFEGSEADLVGAACASLGTTPEAFARSATLHLAKRTLSRSLATNDRPARLAAAYDDLLAANARATSSGALERPITATTLRLRAGVLYPNDPQISFRTATQWLQTRGVSLRPATS